MRIHNYVFATGSRNNRDGNGQLKFTKKSISLVIETIEGGFYYDSKNSSMKWQKRDSQIAGNKKTEYTTYFKK